MDPLRGDGSGEGDIERHGTGRGRGRGSWAPMPSNSRGVQMLRRPHHAMAGAQTAGFQDSRSVEQNMSNKSHEDIIKNSTLSVHAAEFVPKSYPTKQSSQQQQQQHQVSGRMLHKHSIQDRLQMAREMPNHIQGMPSQYYSHNYDASHQYQQTGQHQQYDNFSHQHQVDQRINTQNYGLYDGGAGDYKDRDQESSEDDENYPTNFASTTQYLQNVIRSLILNPGRFTSLVQPLTNCLRPYLELPSQFREIIGIIIQQSVNEGNFRYSGARLCTALDTGMTPNEKASFRESLYVLCKEETDSRASDWQQKKEHTEEDQKKCHGLILFLAELVTQMEDTPAFGLGELLVQLITVVLKKPAPNSVKNICQALKLAGHTLERDKRGSRKEMENMMRALTELVTEGRVDSHVGRMVHSVHELRNGNWGQGPSTADPKMIEASELIEPESALDEPVRYGPDGMVLSAEENQFLEDVAHNTTTIESHAMMEHGFEERGQWPESDDEMDAAYEEFLRLLPKEVKTKSQK